MDRNSPFDKGKALSRVQALCSRQEKSPSDIRAKLISWGASDEQAREIIQLLVDDGYVSETRFARCYANDKARFNHWGPVKIKMMLASKGISNQVIAETLQEIEQLFASEKLVSLIASKVKSVKYNSPHELKMKLVRFAMSKGYSSSMAFSAVEEFLRSANT